MILRGALFAVTVLALSLPAFATPTCGYAPVSVYVQAGYICKFADIVVGNQTYELTIKDVKFNMVDVGKNEVDGVAANLGTLDDYFVTPPANFYEALGLTSPLFNLAEGQHVHYFFDYVIDPPPPVIPGFEEFLDTQTPVFPGYAIVVTDICAGGVFYGPICYSLYSGGTAEHLQLSVFHLGTDFGNKLFDSVKFAQPVSIVGVRNFLDLNAGKKGAGGSAQIQGVQNAINSPEPSAMILAGLGLGAIALIRRRAR